MSKQPRDRNETLLREGDILRWVDSPLKDDRIRLVRTGEIRYGHKGAFKRYWGWQSLDNTGVICWPIDFTEVVLWERSQLKQYVREAVSRGGTVVRPEWAKEGEQGL